MASAAIFWPSSLPQAPLIETWSASPQNVIDAFQPEKGEPITAPTTSVVPENASGVFSMSKAQRQTFFTFWKSTCKRGALPFYMNDPIDGVQAKWLFDPSQRLVFDLRSTERVHVPIALIRLG